MGQEGSFKPFSLFLCFCFFFFNLDRDARTLLAKNLPYKVTQDELKEVFEDAVEIGLVSKDGKSKGIAYIAFKTEADAEKTLEEKQGTEIDGQSRRIHVDVWQNQYNIVK